MDENLLQAFDSGNQIFDSATSLEKLVEEYADHMAGHTITSQTDTGSAGAIAGMGMPMNTNPTEISMSDKTSHLITSQTDTGSAEAIASMGMSMNTNPTQISLPDKTSHMITSQTDTGSAEAIASMGMPMNTNPTEISMSDKMQSMAQVNARPTLTRSRTEPLFLNNINTVTEGLLLDTSASSMFPSSMTTHNVSSNPGMNDSSATMSIPLPDLGMSAANLGWNPIAADATPAVLPSNSFPLSSTPAAPLPQVQSNAPNPHPFDPMSLQQGMMGPIDSFSSLLSSNPIQTPMSGTFTNAMPPPPFDPSVLQQSAMPSAVQSPIMTPGTPITQSLSIGTPVNQPISITAPVNNVTTAATNGQKTCVNCHTDRTPLWRHDDHNQPLCNACGLYYQKHNKRMRPLKLIRRNSAAAKGKKGLARSDAQLVCSNCETRVTPIWRRSEAGTLLCNACGLHIRVYGTPRPKRLRSESIKPRSRLPRHGHVSTPSLDGSFLPNINMAMMQDHGAPGFNL